MSHQKRPKKAVKRYASFRRSIAYRGITPGLISGIFAVNNPDLLRVLGDRRRMRKRLFAVAAAALVPAMGLLAYNELSLRAAREAEIHAEAARAAQHVGSELDMVIEGARSLVIAVSAIKAVNELSPQACSDVVADVARPVESLEAILVLDPSGRVICSSRGPFPEITMADRSYFKEAMTGEDVAVGVYTLGRLSKIAVLPVARAMRHDGQITGVVVAGIKLSWLQERLSRRSLVPGGAYTIADSEGTILARNPVPERFVGTRIPEEWRALVRAKEPGTIELTSQDGTQRVLGYRPISEVNPVYVSAGLSTNTAFADINQATAASVLITAVGTVLALIAANFVGDAFVIRPIEKIIDVLRRWSSGETSARTSMVGRHAEIGLVGVAVDDLLDELTRRENAARKAEEARELVSRELAHRVKNTMSIIQVIAKQTFKRLGNTEEFATFNKRLNSLSGAYDVMLSGEVNEGQIGEIISKAIAPHDDPGHSRFSLSGPDTPLPPAASLGLSLIIHELCTNAAKYGALRHDRGRVNIQWHHHGGEVSLTWTEYDGPPVVPPETEGFGSLLIKRAFPPEFEPRTSFDFDEHGLHFSLTFKLSSGREELLGKMEEA
jgi:two-component sensor histidine kinase